MICQWLIDEIQKVKNGRDELVIDLRLRISDYGDAVYEYLRCIKIYEEMQGVFVNNFNYYSHLYIEINDLSIHKQKYYQSSCSYNKTIFPVCEHRVEPLAFKH